MTSSISRIHVDAARATAAGRAAVLLVACLAFGVDANATPVTVTTPYMNLENRAINSLGFNSGQFLRIGANSVVPNGDAGTTGLATTNRLDDGSFVSRTIPFSPGPAIPNFFQRLLPDDLGLRGAWTLTFSNGTDRTSVIVDLANNATQAPFVNSITLSGTSANPTFTWTPPPASTVNGYRINIYDKSLVSPTNNGQVAGRNLLPTQTSHTVTAADFTTPGYAFALNRNYSIEISLIQTKDGSSSNLANGNLQAIARTYADFTPTNAGGPLVNLPVILANGSYQYNMTVTAGQVYYIDPDVAIGYDYATGAGDPRFASVVLPANIGDGLYDIYGFGVDGALVLLAHDWHSGEAFSFAAGGVSKFRIAGIEIAAGLDPANTTAFITGVSFVGNGNFTGTQTPILAVPEPSVVALWAAGIACIACWRRRRSA